MAEAQARMSLEIANELQWVLSEYADAQGRAYKYEAANGSWFIVLDHVAMYTPSDVVRHILEHHGVHFETPATSVLPHRIKGRYMNPREAADLPPDQR